MASHKGYQHSHNAKSGKYIRQFVRTTKKTGRWRGKLVNIYKTYKKKKKIRRIYGKNN